MIPVVDETHAPGLKSWVASAGGHPDFPVQNLPLGVVRRAGRVHAATRIGDETLDLAALAQAGLLPDEAAAHLGGETLNDLLAQPPSARRALRRALSALLCDPARRDAVAPLLVSAEACEALLPVHVGDYTDFYAGLNHAMNVGRLFRPDAPLLPNYRHVPIGYHGRASSVVASGAPVRRPNGQTLAPGAAAPVRGPTRRLDYELELGVWIGPGNRLGEPVPFAGAEAHVAGLCLLNDWSARDVQTWEYQPLGPFLAKSFMTSVSPWIVTAEALAPFRIDQPARPEGDPAPLPYLGGAAGGRAGAYALTLDVALRTAAMRARGAPPRCIGRAPASALYWTIAQLVAHHASNGCNLRPGDLFGTGTISGPTSDSLGSRLEATAGGARPLELPGGETRTFLEDGDEVVMTARASAPGFVSIGFGSCAGVVTPAVLDTPVNLA